MSYKAWYNEDADYNTNARSYMDYLARHNKFMKVLVEDYEVFKETLIEEFKQFQLNTDETIESFQSRLDNIKQEMTDFFNQWLADGVLDEVINQDILNNKADTSTVNVLSDSLNSESGRIDTLESALTDFEADTEQNLQVLTDTIGQQPDNPDWLNQSAFKSIKYLDQMVRNHMIDITQPPYNVPRDSVSDCSEQIQDALNNAPIRSTIYLPNGKYICKKPLEMTRELTFLGQTVGENGGTQLIADFPNEHEGKILLHLHRTAKNSNIKNLYLSKKSTNAVATIGIGNGDDGQEAITHLNIENVWCVGFSAGFYFDKWYLSRLRNCYAVHNYTGFLLTGEATSIIFDACYANNNTDNYRITNLLYSTFISCASDGASRYGYYLENLKGVVLDACGVETAGHTGFYLLNNRSVTLNSPLGAYNGNVDVPLASFIHVEGDNNGVIINAPYEVDVSETNKRTSSIVIGRNTKAVLNLPNVKLKYSNQNASTITNGQRRSGIQPTELDGSFEVGDFVTNVSGTNTSILGWLCTASGTPGTFRTITI